MKRNLLLALVMALVVTAFPLGAALAEEIPTISFMVQMPSEFVPETDPLVKQIEEATGVHIEWVMPPINSYGENLNLTIVSGDYPDMIQMPGVTSIGYLNAMESGHLLALDEFLPNYENLVNYVDPVSYAALRATSGGALYGIPRNTVVRQDGYAVRKDWLDNLGIELPEDGLVTKDEFYDILYAFTYNDPDQNGVDDTYGLSDNTSGTLTPFFAYAFGNLSWQEHEGEYEYMDERYCQEHDYYKDAIAFTAKMWADGIIDPSWPNIIGNAFRDRFYTGAVGAVRMFGGWLNTYETGLFANFPDAEIAYIVGIKNDDGVCKAPSTFGGNIYSFYSLTKSCAGKEDAALKVLDYILSDEGWDMVNYGIKGLHYDEDESGNKYSLDAYADYNKYRSYITLLRRYDDPGYFVAINCTPDQKVRSYEMIKQAIDITIPELSYSYTSAAAMETTYLDYASEMSTVVSKIIVGDLPIEAYDAALEKWYQNGGADVVAQTIEFIKGN